MDRFRALLIELDEETKELNKKVTELTIDDLPVGEVLIKVQYSSVNYKDGMALLENNKVVTSYPMIPGIDLAGTVMASEDSRFTKGQEVIVTSYDLGTGHFGGYSEYARVPADWIVPLPERLSLREAMIYGTAGFTAALSIKRLLEEGVTKEAGPILVTGATGGVGSMAVMMLHTLGFEVVASTGKVAEAGYLQSLGASSVVDRSEFSQQGMKPLQSGKWQAAIDPVGGQSLANVLAQMRYGGTVAVSGLTGGVKIPTTVMPFIIRGVNLVGIDSANYPMEKRLDVWQFIADKLHENDRIEKIVSEVRLDEVIDVLTAITANNHRGRTIVKI
ncbi:oxidoreductase [Alkalihalobacillus sp. 1P02AB]|uniref:oxidoreductase n=1 Tax=Alkalihalobacillus sp. 1P02AB TaxID=3132260 RepID=UPI0039A6610F